MFIMKAMWEPGWSGFFKNKDPQAIADEIYSISDEPTTQQIVDKARDENTELHDLFEWRDDVAAEQWRIEQARNIFRKLKVTIIPDERPTPGTMTSIPVTPTTARMFYGNPEKSSGFVSVMKVMNNEDTYNALLKRAKDELLSFEHKYSMLSELKPIFKAIHEIL